MSGPSYPGRLVAFIDLALPVDPESDALVETYAAERERLSPLERAELLAYLTRGKLP